MPRPYHNAHHPAHGKDAKQPGKGRTKQAERVFTLLDEAGAPMAHDDGAPLMVTGLTKLARGMVRVAEVRDAGRTHEVKRDRLLSDEGPEGAEDAAPAADGEE